MQVEKHNQVTIPKALHYTVFTYQQYIRCHLGIALASVDWWLKIT